MELVSVIMYEELGRLLWRTEPSQAETKVFPRIACIFALEAVILVSLPCVSSATNKVRCTGIKIQYRFAHHSVIDHIYRLLGAVWLYAIV
jgi:hypothetical protein